MSTLLPRSVTEQLTACVADFRVTIVNGPRQAGKTTLLNMYRESHGGQYRTFDDADQLAAAIADPISYARSTHRPMIIDEVQLGGDPLIRAIKRIVDLEPEPGRFVLAGSSNFLTVPTLSESLAGRAVFVDLWPFSVAERSGANPDFMDRIFHRPAELIDRESSWTRDDYLRLICAGGFPAVVRASSATSRSRWFDGYLRTVISRDITAFAQVRDADAIPQLAGVIAARQGSPFVVSDVASSIGIGQETVRRYLSYLKTVFLTSTVPAWSTNVTNRFVKTPEVFLTDSGLAAHLLSVTPEALAEPGHPMLGPLTESFVFGELLKLRSLTINGFQLYHYRDRDQREIDFICATPDGRVVAIEVKSTATPREKDSVQLKWLRDKLGVKFIAGVVLHMGGSAMSYGDRIFALPLSAMWDHLEPGPVG